MQLVLGNSELIFRRNRNALAQKLHHQFSYGAREIILDYLGESRVNVILAVLQHGEGPAEEFLKYEGNPPRRLFRRYPVLVHSADTRKMFQAQGLKEVFDIGSIWYYCKENIRNQRIDFIPNFQANLEYVLYFPQHFSSNHFQKYQTDSIRRRLTKIRKNHGNQSIVVCLYWVEFQDLRWHRIAKELDIQVVTAGVEMTNPIWSLNDLRVSFLYNLHDLIGKASHCVFDSYSSGIWYAIDMKKSVTVLGNRIFDEKENNPSSAMEYWLTRATKLKIGEYCEPNDLLSVCQDIMGLESFRSSDELRTLINLSESVNYSTDLLGSS